MRSHVCCAAENKKERDFIMKKKSLVCLLSLGLIASMAAGCGSSSTASVETAAQSSAADRTADADAETEISGESAEEAEAEETEAEETVVSASSEEEEVNYRVEELDLYNGDNTIYGEIYLPLEEQDSYPTVIISHGYGGYGNAVAYNAEFLAENGYAAVVFDFCGGGKLSRSDGDTTEMSVLTEASDLEAVMDEVKELDYVDSDHLFLLGESQGGFVSTYVATQRPDEVKALVCYYPAYVLQDNEYTNHPDPDAIEDTYEFMGLTLSRIYYDDATSFDIFDLMPEYTGDVLIQHGDADTIAPIEYSERAVETFENAELITIPGANHGWGGGDMSRDEVIEIVSANTLEFLNAHLS